MKDLSDIVCAIAGPTTQRSFENLRRTLEDLYVKSTAQGSTPEDQAVFSPELIAQAHEAARRDNAKAIVSWAKAIYDELQAQEPANKEPDYIDELKKSLRIARSKKRFFTLAAAQIAAGGSYPTLSGKSRERQAESTQRAIQEAQEEISRLEQDLRDLQEPQASVPGRPPQAGQAGTEPPGHDDLDGPVPPVS